ncbi:MAG TPA: ribonuclease R [Saprospiraceae bacterium]|nr:ribonuclease R [Saprospiraceae bacterium]
MTKKRKSRSNNIKGKKLTNKQLQHEVLKLLRRNPKKRYNPKQLVRKMQVQNNKDAVQHALDKLVESNKAVDLGNYKYKFETRQNNNSSNHSGKKRQTLTGRVDMTRTGSAYIIIDSQEQDVHVSPKYINGALNGDIVKIRTWYPRGRRKPEGEVMEVVERSQSHFIGTYWEYPKYALVTPDGPTQLDILINKENNKGAKDGEKVVVKVIEWPDEKRENPLGAITSVLGKAGSSDIEMKSILVNSGFQLDFPNEVLKESEAIPLEIDPSEIERRRDMRDVLTCTIDPDTAKDFDDALSYRKLENGNVEIGVHIADVTHYVRENGPLDKEALERSTSVYLVDRVLPMLPEKLSNGVCSLRPNEDKLVFSAVFEFNKNIQIVKRWFGKAVIHSDRRFTYEEAQQVLDGESEELSEELRNLNRIAKVLQNQRFKQGSINFETDEVKFRLADDGTPIDVYIKERKDAHMLIEDFMLLANREVAAFINRKSKELKQEIPYVYRVHDLPDLEKAAEIAKFAEELGFKMDVSSPESLAKSYNRMQKAAQKDQGLKLLQPLAIRTMAKAEYSSENIGHYGLGFDYYTHFTSPIRRYSDVLSHRLLELNLDGRTFVTNKMQLEEQCKHISRQERKAVEAERESIKYKQVEFIEKHVGESFEGIVSGFSDRGLFVELLGNHCEGMVNYNTMDEAFEVADSRLYITGKRSGVQVRMGDKVRVKILDADLMRRRIDMGWEAHLNKEK